MRIGCPVSPFNSRSRPLARVCVSGPDSVAPTRPSGRRSTGYAATNLQFHSQRWSLDLISRAGNRLFAQDENAGALPTLYAAVADIPGNSFAGPSGFVEQRGAPKLVGRSAAAQDADVARRLWEVSDQLTSVRFPLPAVSSP